MKKFVLLSLVFAGSLLHSSPSIAAPVSLQLTLTTDSSGDLFLSILGNVITASVPFDLSGTIDVLLDDAIDGDLINDSTGIAFIDAQLNLSDETFDIAVGFLGGVLGEIAGLEINTLSSSGNIPLTTTSPVDPFEHTFDSGSGPPTAISIDDGLYTYIGTGAAGGIDAVSQVDFSLDPLSGNLNVLGQTGMLTQDAVLSDGYVYVTISAPIEFSDSLLTDPLIGVDFSAAIVATGFYPIPEPSTVVLLGIAILGLIPIWRKLHR